MNKKYKIKIEDEVIEFETEKEFKQFKKDYNEYEIMISEQLNVGKGIKKTSRGGITTVEPEITLKDVLIMINNLTIEVREGFRRNDERWEKQEEFNKFVLKVFEINHLKTS